MQPFFGGSVSALELSDLLPELGELTPTMAQSWISASLAQAAALREHDQSLYPTDATRLHAAERLHAAWRNWSEDAQILLLRADSLRAAGQPVGRTDELRDAVGRALAMLQLTPAEAMRRRERARNGTVRSVEEVRRELQLQNRR